MNAFHVIGGITAIWALLVSALGVFVRGFPGRLGEKVVIAISVILVAGSISSAIYTAIHEDHEGGRGEQTGAAGRAA